MGKESTFRGRCKGLIRKLTRNPFFPLTFIGEAAKTTSFHLIANQPGIKVAIAANIMAVLSIVTWLYSIDDVKWGLYEVAETVEDVTDE